MTRLCDVPYEKLAVGQKLISAVQSPGYIDQMPQPGDPVALPRVSPFLCPHPDLVSDHWLVIRWDNGNTSFVEHTSMKAIEWTGEAYESRD